MSRNNRLSSNFVLFGVSGCFLLSGFAALLYQTAWLRQFSITFGTSEVAIAAVLAAYMAGLGAGAWIAAKFIHRITRPILAYGVLEGGIALTALAVPFMLSAAQSLLVALMGGLDYLPNAEGLTQTAYYLFASFLILALPTSLMGATLPLLIRHVVESEQELGKKVALLYAINTGGAVLGTIAAGFYFLPTVGLQATVWVGVFANAFVFVLAAWLSSHSSINTQARKTILPAPMSTSLHWIMPVMMLSGVASFAYEVLWTRVINHALGGTVYAFATMLATFLTGIALGGLIAGRFADNRETASRAFVWCQILVGGLSAVLYLWLENYTPLGTGIRANASLIATVMLPATLFIGATFPLAVRILSVEASDASSASGQIYAWNTAGAIIGAVLAGYFIIPALGFHGTIVVLVTTNLLLATFVAFKSESQPPFTFALALASVVAAVTFRPGIPFNLIDTSVVDDGRGGNQLFYAVGRSSTVLMKQSEGYFYLRTNGLPEAFIEPKGAPPMRHSQKWLTALPALARPDAESMLVVGLGGGVALEGVPPHITSVDVVELESLVTEANSVIGAARRFNPLDDQRVNIVTNDARNALLLSDKAFDIIVSQPSHPWTAGASHLYTSEFIALAKQHLSRNGVFLQWINSVFVDEALLKTLTATLLDQFDNVRLYQPAPTIVMFLASDHNLNVEQVASSKHGGLTQFTKHYESIGISSVEDLLVSLTLDEAGTKSFARSAAINTDNDNRLALHSQAGTSGLQYADLLKTTASLDPLLDVDSAIRTDLPDISYTYIAERMIYGGFAERASLLVPTLSPPSLALTVDALGLRYAGKSELSERVLTAAADLDKASPQTKYALVWPYLGRLASQSAPREISQVADSLGGSARAVLDGWELGAQRKWTALARLDPSLALAKPTDAWYPEAVKLRADWRIQGTRSAEASREALGILDKALISNALTDLLVIRAAATLRQKDTQAFIETAYAVSKQMSIKLQRIKSDGAQLSRREWNTMLQRARGFEQQLRKASSGRHEARANEVQQGFEALRQTLESHRPAQ